MKQKEPFLTGISTLLDGSMKRSAQAVIQQFRKKALRQSISGYGRLFDFILPADFLVGIDAKRRRSKFDLITVFWAWIAQILDGNTSCSKVSVRCLTIGQFWRAVQS